MEVGKDVNGGKELLVTAVTMGVTVKTNTTCVRLESEIFGVVVLWVQKALLLPITGKLASSFKIALKVRSVISA